jgi:hypothetical protein
MRFFLIIMFLFPSLLLAAERRIDLNWDPIEGAKSYEIELFELTKDGEINLGIFSSSGSLWGKDVKPGRYKVRLRALDRRDVPGEWSEPIPVEVKFEKVQTLRPYEAENVSEEEVVFQWNKISGARKYQIIIMDSEKKVVTNEVILKTEWRRRLGRLGNYNWTVLALRDDEAASKVDEVSEGQWKILTRVGGQLEAPEVELKVGPEIIGFWDKVEHAVEYELSLYPPEESSLKPVRQILKKNEFRLKPSQLAPGITTVYITAKAPLYKDSKRATLKIAQENGRIKQHGKSEEAVSAKTLSIKKHWLQLNLSFGNGRYAAVNSETDTTVGRTPLLAQGFAVDYQFTPLKGHFQHQLYADSYQYSKGVSASSWQLQYSFFKKWNNNQKHWGAGPGMGLRSWPVILPDRLTGSFEQETTMFVTPQAGLYYEDFFTKHQAVRLEAAAFYNLATSKGSLREVDSFLSTALRLQWKYFIDPDQALSLGINIQNLKAPVHNESFQDQQELSLVVLMLGWGIGF